VSTTCEELRPLLAARTVNALDATEETLVTEHLARCSQCPELVRELTTALEATHPERRKAPDRSWERLARALEEERSGGSATPLGVRVILSCTFCHSVLRREEARFCASCLAPHHLDCFETHGRCSAPGCSETLLVEPRSVTKRAKPRRRWIAPVVALALGGGVVAALDPFGARRATTPAPSAVRLTQDEIVALSGESGHKSEPYPWPDPLSSAIPGKLAGLRCSPQFNNTPLKAALAEFKDFSGVEVNVDPELHPDDVKVNLRLNDVSDWNTLLLIAATVPDTVVTLEGDGLRIVSETKPVADRAYTAATSHGRVRALLDDGPSYANPLAWRLGAQKVNFNFDGTPLAEVIQFLSEVTRTNFVIATEIDAEEVKISARLRDELVTDALKNLLEPLGLRYVYKGDVVRIEKADEKTRELLNLARRRVSLELRGATVPELVRALEHAGIDAVAAPEAWISSGTFSLDVRQQSVTDVIATIASRTPLHAWIGVDERKRESLVIEGLVTSVESALTSSINDAFPSVAAEIAELREPLGPEVAARARLRADPSAPLDELYSAERTVDLTASRILELVRRSRTVAFADRDARSKEAELTPAKKELEMATAERERARTEQWAIKSDHEHKFDAADAALKALEKDVLPASLTGEKAAEWQLRHEVEKKRLQDAFELEKMKTEIDLKERAIALNLAENKVRLAESNVERLTRELGAIQVDVRVLDRLRRGARLAEAEGAHNVDFTPRGR
jgi:hypothetical protein